MGFFDSIVYGPFVSSSAFQIGHREEDNATFNPVVNGDWHDVMSKTNHEQQNAYRMYPTKPWPERLRGGGEGINQSFRYRIGWHARRGKGRQGDGRGLGNLRAGCGGEKGLQTTGWLRG